MHLSPIAKISLMTSLYYILLLVPGKKKDGLVTYLFHIRKQTDFLGLISCFPKLIIPVISGIVLSLIIEL